MQYTNLIWRDGLPYSEQFDDIYYSSDEGENIPGESEFSHVFFRHNGLPERWQWRDDFVIAELGFGSGLNCVLTIREWLKHCAECDQKKTLHYIAIEKYPLPAETIAQLISRYPDLKPFCDALLDDYPPAIETTHSRSLFDNQVVIHFKFMDASAALDGRGLNVDAWYLDGFSPAKNPDMWSQELFENIAINSRDGASCSTYTAAGFVRRNLRHAGFVVDRVSGYGKKRDMIVARLPAERSANRRTPLFKYKNKPWFEPPPEQAVSIKDATIIGAGIAGLSLAYALVQRGLTVTVVDDSSNKQKQASSNPAPIVYPRLSINNDVDTEFFTAAYCHALYVFRSLQKKSQQRFWFDEGLLQLMDKKRITQIINKFQLNSDFISIVERPDSDVFCCREEGQVVVEYKSAGVVLPAVLCDVIKNECGSKLAIIEAEITNVTHDGEKWQCFHEAKLIKESEVLIVANGSRINNLGLPLVLPVEIIRGQVVELDETTESRQIKKTLNAEVHITPAINGKHYLGATYAKGCDRLEICQTDNRKLLDSLDDIYPGIFKKSDHCDSWVGFRTVSKDRVPIVGAVPDEKFFNNEYSDICHGSTKKNYPPASYLTGLYVSAAHGSRGFTSCFISAEIIASQLACEPSPVSRRVRDYLSSSRFIVNDLKRG